MNTYNYQQFVRESRDEIASWIADPEQAHLFAKDLDERNNALKKFNAEWNAQNQRYTAWLKSPKGRRAMNIYNDKLDSYTKKRREFQERLSEWEQAKYFHKKEPARYKHPGPKPQEPKLKLPKQTRESVTKELKSPLENFMLPIKPIALNVNDYRVLLGAIHDGFTWHEGDKSQYICPKLRKKGTIVDVLFWDYMWKEPGYKPLIEEALRVVESDMNDIKQNEQQGRDGQDKKTQAKSQGQRRKYPFDRNNQETYKPTAEEIRQYWIVWKTWDKEGRADAADLAEWKRYLVQDCGHKHEDVEAFTYIDAMKVTQTALGWNFRKVREKVRDENPAKTEVIPQDLITITIAVKNYNVSRRTIYRATEDGRLQDYNKNKKANNSPVMISESEVARHFLKRSAIPSRKFL